jgi:hypothetical protein
VLSFIFVPFLHAEDKELIMPPLHFFSSNDNKNNEIDVTFLKLALFVIYAYLAIDGSTDR